MTWVVDLHKDKTGHLFYLVTAVAGILKDLSTMVVIFVMCALNQVPYCLPPPPHGGYLWKVGGWGHSSDGGRGVELYPIIL